jgi:cytochrome c553
MRLAIVLGLGALICAGTASADITGDRAAGRKLSNQCRTCHGAEGMAQLPIAPHIGGEPEAYLQAQLTAFRDGTRKHEMMSIVARSLTDQQIADLAAWYAGHRITATVTGDPEQAPALCSGCHGADGLHLVDDAPHLAGEANIYIDTQLKAFRQGSRISDIMGPIAEDLTDEEIRAAADWYSQVQVQIDLVE